MEVWKDISHYTGYQVSNHGRVRSCINNRYGPGTEWHFLKPIPNRHGYQTVLLGRNSRKLVSRLVAEAFIPNPDNLPIVRHMDDNPSNNHASNLRWGTQKDNMQDCVRHGRLVGDTRAAIESKKQRIVAIRIDNGRTLHFNSLNDAARELNLWVQHISSALKGRISQTGGWRFEYAKGDDLDVCY